MTPPPQRTPALGAGLMTPPPQRTPALGAGLMTPPQHADRRSPGLGECTMPLDVGFFHRFIRMNEGDHHGTLSLLF
jgi:hypothetical protein